MKTKADFLLNGILIFGVGCVASFINLWKGEEFIPLVDLIRDLGLFLLILSALGGESNVSED